jgi:predicted phage tail protein
MPQVVVFTVFGVAVTYGAIIQFALVVAGVIYSRQQAKKAKRAMQNSLARGGGFTITSRDPSAARRIIYGTQRVGGTMVYLSSSGDNNEFLHMVIVLAGHKVNFISDIYFDDEAIPLDANGNATGRLAGFAYVEKHLGDPDQLASTALMAAKPQEWTSAHRLRGVAYIYVRIKYDTSKFTREPNVSAVVDGKQVLDVRNGLTRFSHNAALCWRDYMCDPLLGLGCDADEIDDDSVVVAANICDERVATGNGGDEARYCCDGCVDTAAQPADIVEDILSGMAGWGVYTGGLWHVRAGAHQYPAASFTPDDVRGEIAVQTKASRRDTCNAVKGVFVSPLNKWQVTDFPPVKNQMYYEQDGNERIWRDVEYPFTISPSAAQRLAKIELEQARQDISVRLPLMLTGLRVKAGDVVELTIDRYGWVRKQFEVTGWKFTVENADIGSGGSDGASAPTLGVDVELRETSAGVWDWNMGEETIVDLAPNVMLPDPLASPNPSGLTLRSGSDVLVRGNDGTIISRILATWNLAPSQFVQSGGNYEIAFKRSADGEDTWVSVGSVPGYVPRVYISPVEDGVEYDVLVRSVNNLGAVGDWIRCTGHKVVGKTAAPAAPVALSVRSGTVGTLIVSWTNASDPDLKGVEVYESDAATPAPAANTPATAFVSASEWMRGGLGDGETKYYWARSVDTSGNHSAWVGPEDATTGEGGDPVRPDVPSSVKVAGGFEQIGVSWTQENIGNVNYWEAYVSDTAGGAPVDTLGSLVSAIFMLNGLAAGTTRYVRVRAVGRGGLASDWSPEVSGTTFAFDTEKLDEIKQSAEDTAEGLREMADGLTTEISNREQQVAALGQSTSDALAGIDNELALKATALEALATALAKTIAAMGDSHAAISHEEEVRVSAVESLARVVSTIITTLGDSHAAVQVLSEAFVGADGKAVAKWVLSLAAGNVITGMEATAQNGPEPISEIKFLADVFSVVSQVGGQAVNPFLIKNGNVYINKAVMGELAVSDLQGGTITGKEIILGSGGVFRSSNFVQGVSGVRITSAGIEAPQFVTNSPGSVTNRATATGSNRQNTNPNPTWSLGTVVTCPVQNLISGQVVIGFAMTVYRDRSDQGSPEDECTATIKIYGQGGSLVGVCTPTFTLVGRDTKPRVNCSIIDISTGGNVSYYATVDIKQPGVFSVVTMFENIVMSIQQNRI